MTKVDPNKFKEMWLAGKSLKEITKEFNCTIETVKYWRNKLGLPKRRNLPKPKIDIQKVIELIKSGHTCFEAGRILGYAPISVVTAVRRAGLSCRELRKGSKVIRFKSLIDEILKEEGIIIYSEFKKHYGYMEVQGYPISIRLIKAVDPDLNIIKLQLGGLGGSGVSGRRAFGKFMKYNNTYVIFRDWSKFKEFVLKHVVITPENKKIVAARLRRSGVPREIAKEIVDEGLKIFSESQKT